jgi:multidrug efflux pump subunit AcrA (membrane-fusion protein)
MLNLSRFKIRLSIGSKNKLSLVKTTYRKSLSFLDKKPLTSFFVVLTLLMAVIVIGNFARKPKVADEIIQPQPKEIQVYSVGEAPKITVQAQIEKSGIVKITAQTPGIVSQVNVQTGDKVSKGANLLSLSSNYNGSNPLSVARQIAGVQFKSISDNLPVQKDLISKQRELADKNKENFEKLRGITNDSLDATRSLISLNDNIISQLQTQLQSQAPGSTAYISTQAQISQFQSANNQIRQGLRNSEFQTNTDNAPTKINDLSTDIAKKQLDLQEKSLDLSKELASLQLRLALVNEANYFPVSPFAGTVQRVHVQVGQAVNPGTVLVTIAGNDRTATAQAFVPINIARNISNLVPSVLHFPNQTLDLMPTYVSEEATEGQLYSVLFAIPEDAQNVLTDKSYIKIELPLETSYTLKSDPFVPIDSVHQTQDEAFVYITKNGKAQSRKVTLGEVQGNFIQVIAGLLENDKVITNRNVLAGDKVKISL